MRDQYKNIARWYDRIFEPLNCGLRMIGMKIYPPKAGMDVLDIGCGTGARPVNTFNPRVFRLLDPPLGRGVQ